MSEKLRFSAKGLYFVVLAGLGVSTLAQEAVSPPEGADIEELVVPGRTPGSLRVEIERLETSVYERFNALNTNDELDIHCFEQAPTGSNIPLRTCAPNFVIEAESRAARKILADGRGSSTNNRDTVDMRLMQEKSLELTEEMQRIAREDEQLLRDLMRLDELRQLSSNGGGRR